MDNRLEYWYKFSITLVIEVENCLVVSIGWLYWSTLNCAYTIKGLKIPLVYNTRVRYLIMSILVVMGCIMVVSLVEAILIDVRLDKVLNWLILGSTVVSATFFVAFRVIYYQNMASSIQMNRKAYRKENFYNAVIIIASLGRVSLCVLSAL